MIELTATIENGKLKMSDKRAFDVYLNQNEGKKVVVSVKQYQALRTSQQNKALHLWCTHIAEALNKNGVTMQMVLNSFKEGVEIYATPQRVKEDVIKLIVEYVYGKKSTTELIKDGEIDKLVDIVTKFTSERWGFAVPFPSKENLMNE